MTLRIRFGQGRLVKRRREHQGELAQATASLLTPACVMAYVLAFWRLAADIGVTSDSGLQGVFSHWQLWLVLAVGLHWSSRNLNRRPELSPARLGDQVPDRVE